MLPGNAKRGPENRTRNVCRNAPLAEGCGLGSKDKAGPAARSRVTAIPVPPGKSGACSRKPHSSKAHRLRIRAGLPDKKPLRAVSSHSSGLLKQVIRSHRKR